MLNDTSAVNIETMKEEVRKCLAVDQPIFLWGPPGVGKSEGVAQLAEEEGMRFIDVRVSQLDAVDVRGIPHKTEDNRTEWAVPIMWPAEDDDRPTLIMVDEINHGTQATLSAMFQAIQERRIGEYQFPKTVRFVAAGNRSSDRTYANKMPSALNNRFSHISVEATENDWCKWANANDFSPLVTGFIRFSPDSLNEFTKHNDSEEEQKRLARVKTNTAFGTPRTWAAVNKFVVSATTDGDKVDLQSIQNLISGTVGDELAAKFVGYAQYYKDLPDLDALLKAPLSFAVPTAPAMQYAICAGLANKATMANFGNLIKYILQLPAEFQAMCVKDSLARDISLSATPEFAEWAVANDDVIF